MRSRLTALLVVLVAGTVVVAGVGTLLVTRRAARSDAVRQLLAEATTFADAAGRLHTGSSLKIVGEVLSPEDGEDLVLGPAGGVRVIGAAAFGARLPGQLTLAAIRPARLLSGSAVSGSVGSTAFAAVPAGTSARVAAVLPPGSRAVVLLTRDVGALGPGWAYIVLISGVTLVVAAAVAAWLARRITEPLVEASTVTGRIARGELAARVTRREPEYPELAVLGDSINSMAERLQGGRDRERQLLLSVSHDLRTPLTSIRGYAEAIEDGVAADVPAAAGVIVNEARRLERLVADLLDLARLGADQLSLHVGPVDAGTAVASAAEAFRARAEAAGVALEVAVPAPPLLVSADPDRLAQVVANLVENAVSFARSRVAVAVADSGPGSARLVVEDDGPGIAEEDLERIFDRFYRADRGGGARGGLGLGLSIVAELVRAMGGQVRAESPLGSSGGTRMVVGLRLWQS